MVKGYTIGAPGSSRLDIGIVQLNIVFIKTSESRLQLKASPFRAKKRFQVDKAQSQNSSING